MTNGRKLFEVMVRVWAGEEMGGKREDGSVTDK